MKHLRRCWKEQTHWMIDCPSRKTVEDMLLGNGFGEVKPREAKKYHPPLARHYPNAQVVLDGKEAIVGLQHQAYRFVLELCQDIATDNIGGSAIAASETKILVEQAMDNHCATYGNPLAALVDNRSGNLKAELDFGKQGILVVRSHPYRAETKGTIEGEFGIFEKKISTIAIDGTEPEEMALSILTQIVAIYIRLRNQTPRCSVCPFTPGEMMKYQATAEQKQQAYDLLKAAKERKRLQQEQQMKVSQEFHDLVDSIVKEHGLSGDRLTLKRNLKHCSLSSLREAESRFAVQSKRDTFTESKRTMAYFTAIARNIQQEKDQAEKQAAARRRYGLDLEAKQKRAEIQAQVERKAQEKERRLHPEREIVAILKAEMALPPAFRDKLMLHKNRLHEAVEALLKRKTQQQIQLVIKKTEKEVMQLSEFSLDVRYQMVSIFKEKISSLIHESG